ncbi:WPP domain-interacting tail-anchored protein 2-like [Rutidosis leptorrhynchoides]|uniref:WPP domain-interacting tail-anchored protein 2-like n=1 Tax=Rutidosis leptorrhynchoides TaxID=125765 RepID=UPI003A98D815
MESVIESLKENIESTENRAETAELKVTELTYSNVELSEELEIITGSHENSSNKMSLLEIQLQHTKASSESGQEQQNILYSAIRDMETLIDELKQKVSTAEIRAESAEDQCLLLTNTKSELTKEVATERERITKQLHTQTEEKKIMMQTAKATKSQ